MKKLISVCLALVMLFSLVAVVLAEEGDLAADGWSVANDNFLGWTKEGDVITGDFNVGWENVEPISLWKDAITDFNNFSVEMDIVAGNMTSPFIRVMGVQIEPDGNGGDGNQVYLKTNNTAEFAGNNKTYDWLKAAGCKVHITITRMDGGDLTVQIVGASSDSVAGESKTLTVEATNPSAVLEIGVFRGSAQFGGVTVANGDEVVAPTEPEPTEPSEEPTEPEETKATEPIQPEPTEPAKTDPDGGNTVIWIVIAAVAVVAVVVVVVVVGKKKKA